MKWLITVQKSADLDKLAKAIRDCGGEPDPDNLPVPLGDSELVVQASGPAELPNMLKADAAVIDVYPNSEMQLY